MVNVTVVRGKDIIKYIVKITFFMIITIGLTKFLTSSKQEDSEKLSKVFENIKNKLVKESSYEYINKTLPVVQQVNEENKNEEVIDKKTAVKSMLLSELEVIESLKKVEEKPAENLASTEKDEVEQKNKNNSVQINPEILEDVETEVLDSGINTSYTNVSGKVYIKNESSYELTEEMLVPEICINNKKDILLFHTHTCESYTPSAGYEYEASGSYRTTDLNFSVARVGEALKEYLTGYNYNVIHDTTYHDYPAYSGSYSRSLETVSSILAANPRYEMVFDLHRDAIGSNSDYAPTVRIGDEYAAQLMFVIGTDGGGLEHPNWLNNFKFAIAVQQTAEELYPGLFKTMIVRNSRYNQHVSSGAAIIEVGATGNTMEQCLTSMKYLARVISEVVK